jgi:polar amino acid transport system permease protein
MNFDLSALNGSWQSLAQGFGNTLWLCAVSAVLALLLGGLFTFGLLRGGVIVSNVIRVYTALALGLPLLVLLYIAFFVLPEFDVLLPGKLVGTVTLALYYAPYAAGVMRAAISAIPPGTLEAAHAMGMPPAALARRIVMPQALPLLLPTLTGLAIGLLKDSALLSVISVHEFMFAAKESVSQTYAPLEVYVVVALVYWGGTSLINALTRRWERRLGEARGQGMPR